MGVQYSGHIRSLFITIVNHTVMRCLSCFLAPSKGCLPSLVDTTLVSCWIHARKKFFEAASKKNKEKEHLADQALLMMFKELFKKEQSWKDIPSLELSEKRVTEYTLCLITCISLSRDSFPKIN